MKNFPRILLQVTLACFIPVAFIACGNAGNQNSDKEDSKDPIVTALQMLEKEVIDVHDEVMPKMAELNNARVKLLKHYGDEELSAEKRTDLSSAIQHLEEADSLMWDWMHNFNRPDYMGNLDSIKLYLENEKVTVVYMKEKFLSSMDEGETLLIKYSNDDE